MDNIVNLFTNIHTNTSSIMCQQTGYKNILDTNQLITHYVSRCLWKLTAFISLHSFCSKTFNNHVTPIVHRHGQLFHEDKHKLNERLLKHIVTFQIMTICLIGLSFNLCVTFVIHTSLRVHMPIPVHTWLSIHMSLPVHTSLTVHMSVPVHTSLHIQM